MGWVRQRMQRSRRPQGMTSHRTLLPPLCLHRPLPLLLLLALAPACLVTTAAARADGAADAVCPANITGVPDVAFVGTGRCASAAGATAWAFGCSGAECGDVGASLTEWCAAACARDPGCTGFELRGVGGNASRGDSTAHDGGGSGGGDGGDGSNGDSSATATGCFVLVAAAPADAPNATANTSWTPAAGTQPDRGRVVATAVPLSPPWAPRGYHAGSRVSDDGDGSARGGEGSNKGSGNGTVSCCYKRAYPRPNPAGNPVPLPPTQSNVQRAVFAAKAAEAANASAAALPKLLALVEFCAANATSNGTAQDLFGPAACPGMAGAIVQGHTRPTAQQLLDRFALELRGAEYAHGYSTLSKLMHFDEVFDPSYPFLLNLYEPCALGLNITDAPSRCGWPTGWLKYDEIMQDLFGCPRFKSGNPPLDFHDAADRIVYTSMNWQRMPAANSLYYGTIQAVLRPRYVQDMVLFTPTDSYHYIHQWPQCPHWKNCTVGTMQDHHHILYAWMVGGGPAGDQYTPDYVPDNCEAQMEYLRTMTCDLPSFETECALRSDFKYYWESDLLGTVAYPDGVKLIVGSFRDDFGNAARAAALRAWCRRNGWALAWTLHNAAHCLDPRRLLDLDVLNSTTVNVTVPAPVAAQFAVLRDAARSPDFVNSSYLAAWAAFTNETHNPGAGGVLLRVTTGAMHCEDYDGCLGTTDSTRECACYQ